MKNDYINDTWSIVEIPPRVDIDVKGIQSNVNIMHRISMLKAHNRSDLQVNKTHVCFFISIVCL